MSNKPSSYPVSSQIPPMHRWGGRLGSMPELPIHALGDVYEVEGSGTVTALPAWPKGPPVLLRFVGTPTFKNSSRLQVQGGADFTFAVGDCALMLPLGDGAWQCFVFPANTAVAYAVSYGAPQSLTATQQNQARANIGVPLIGMANGKIIESHASGAASYALKTLAGNDPSAADPVTIYFADGTSIQQTTACSCGLSSGSTVGAPSALAFRLWFVLINDAGTLRLGVRNCSDANGIYGFPGNGVMTSTAEGGAGGATSAGVTYTGTAVAGKPFVIAAFADYEAGLATAGTWNASPTRILSWFPGMPKPGDVIKSKSGSSAVGTANSTTSYVLSGVSVSMALDSPCNIAALEIGGMAAMADPTGFGYVGVIRGGNLIGFDLILGGGSAAQLQWNARHSASEKPNSTALLTWAVGVKAFTSGKAITYPSTVSSAVADSGWITVSEVMV